MFTTRTVVLFALLALLGYHTIQTIHTVVVVTKSIGYQNNVNENPATRRGGSMKTSRNRHSISIPIARKKIPLSELTRTRMRTNIDPNTDTANAANAIHATHSTSDDSSKPNSREECKEPFWTWIENKEKTTMDDSNSTFSPYQQRIPLIIHQTASSRCIPSVMADTISSWIDLPMYQYYFHDDDAIWRLLNQDWPEFPFLKQIIRCLNSMTALTDLWRLLVLWEYGGVYSDLDAIPNSWTPASIHPDDDAYMVVENFDAPSQYFMAVTPRHPLMFYAMHTAMINVLETPSVTRLDPAMATGPFALLDGFSLFMLDVDKTVGKPVVRGYYQGANNRSVRIDGYGRERSDEIILREAIPRASKKEMYESMNMTHFLDVLAAGRKSKRRSRSCLAVLYDVEFGPPPWYVPSDSEDRVTIGGPS
jgi:hypothetical protein